MGCLTTQHDPWIVALAAFVCGAASFAVVRLLRHAESQSGRNRGLWLATCAFAGGAGAWSTHFVAMLAYDPGLPTGFTLGLTLLSFLIVVSMVGTGVLAAVDLNAALGGAIAGLGVAVMHFVGMAALETGGEIVWDYGIVAAAVAMSICFGAAAFHFALHRGARYMPYFAALVFAFSILSLHFTAMGAVTIVPDPRVALPEGQYAHGAIAAAVALTSMLVLLSAGAALARDVYDLRRNKLEAQRMNSLANASAECLIICRGDVIVMANETFWKLSGSEWRDAPIRRFFDTARIWAALDEGSEAPFEGELMVAAGPPVPVELFVRAIDVSDGARRYAIAARDLRAQREAEREIRYLAHYDPLTGLANRSNFARAIEEREAAARASNESFSVLLIDLDRFKEINDWHGHAAGDAMLKRTAAALQTLIGPGEMLARLGGDEFALLTRVGGRKDGEGDDVERLADGVLDVLNADEEDGVSSTAGASVGSATFPEDASDAETLLLNADIALYRAKSDGRGVWRAFDASLGAEVQRRLSIEHDLRGAVRRKELWLVFQPQLAIATGELRGYEALARWRRPNGEEISPGVFIPMAEKNGLIGPIGAWALRVACQEAARWTRPLSISVNISADQLRDPALGQIILQSLAESGLSPSRLVVEITETALVSHPDRALATLRQIKALGVGISMDDFGIGYSSLSHLHMYPFDKFKIDQSFVRNVHRDPQKAAIVRTMIALGRELGLPTLAEGVETEEELAFLRAQKCDLVQGFLVGRPGSVARDGAPVAASVA